MSNHTAGVDTMTDDYSDIRAAFTGKAPEQSAAEIRAKKLETVRGLMDKAMSTDNPVEADAFRAKADALMEAFAIEQWQVDQARAATNERPKPEIRNFKMEWWYESDFYSQLWSMFISTANHCRCVVALRGRRYGTTPVIGIPSDLDYFDMLFTSLMIQMVGKMSPKPDPTKSFDENAYDMRTAGVKRPVIGQMMWDAKIPSPALKVEDMTAEWDPRKDERGRMRNRTQGNYIKALRTAAERWAAEHELESSVVGTGTTGTVVWQRSFTDGFVYEISERMYEIKANQRRARGETEEVSVSIALRDIKQQAVDLYEETWPAPKPCENCANGTCKVHKKSKAVAYRYVARNRAAYGAGKGAGRTADISNQASQRVGNKRGQLHS